MQDFHEASRVMGLEAVFILLLVTLGPVKIVGPFAHLTRDVDEAQVKKIAVRTFVLAVIAVVIGGFVGKVMVENWQISVPALTLAGGIIFFLVGLSWVLEQYRTTHATPPPLPAAPMAAALRLAFPTVVTPYGMAALITLLVISPDAARTASILAILIGVMVLNFLAMLYARRIIDGGVVMAPQILGAVLGVLQVAFAVQIILRGLDELGVL